MSAPTSSPARILIVEDDPTLQRVLKDNFEFAGHQVRVAPDGRRGWELFTAFNPDLVILDLMLPHVNGFELCRRIRAENASIPILMVTARGQESDIIRGLNLGADDYVTKPFSIDVLLARVNACLRHRMRADEKPDAVLFGDCRVDLRSHQVFRQGREVVLTPKEFALLEYLATQPRRAWTRDQLLDAVWGADIVVTQRSVDRCVTTLRGKIEHDPAHPRHILTVRDVGYRFEPTETPASEPQS